MNLVAGQEIPNTTLNPIDQAQLARYAKASGDTNPIHLDEKVAIASGLPGVIAHGMLSAAFLAERARELAPNRPLKNYKCRFKAMLALGDSVTISGFAKEANRERLVLELVAKNQKGETVTTAVVQLGPLEFS